jgi:hypothetical protein
VSFRGVDVRQANTDWLVIRALLLDSAGAKVTTGTASLYLYEIQQDVSLKSFDFYDKMFKTTALIEETLLLKHQRGNGTVRDTGIWSAGFSTVAEDESSNSSSSWSSSSSSQSVSTSSSSDTVSSSSTSSLSTSSLSSSSHSVSTSSTTSVSSSSSSTSSLSSSSHSLSDSSPADETPFTVGNIYIAMVNHSSASPPWQAREFQYGETQGDGLVAIADAVLLRNWFSVGQEVPDRCLLQAARFIRNKFSLTARVGFVTVYEEDGVTIAYQKPITTDAAAIPIVEG